MFGLAFSGNVILGELIVGSLLNYHYYIYTWPKDLEKIEQGNLTESEWIDATKPYFDH